MPRRIEVRNPVVELFLLRVRTMSLSRAYHSGLWRLAELGVDDICGSGTGTGGCGGGGGGSVVRSSNDGA